MILRDIPAFEVAESFSTCAHPYRNEPIWSRAELTIARTVFDAALKRDLHEVMQETRRRANQISEPDDLWDLERYPSQRRKDIDGKTPFLLSRPAGADDCVA